MLRGRYITRLDKSGRLRFPANLRKSIEDKYGREVFITSLDGEHVQIFPVQEWKKMTSIENKKAFKNPVIRNFALRINRMGVMREIDRWGRIMIHKELRTKTNIKARIAIEGGKELLILKRAY